ncbi:MAG: 1-deoxy-D-xylulose-5-phosphate synthase [Oscillospiraceae bacterium]|nr:1-deoxy-D-xylulose-5-phosphate synthase [Oscillospiraceae bacterium]
MNRERQFDLQKAVTLHDLKLPEELSELSVQQCTALCSEIRNLLIGTVLKTGGHLSSNLGVVELTLSLHRNFRSPEDRIVWDVGHQAYVHKILTGRADQLSTLRQENGLAGFPKPTESVHDTFITGHSSTAVSAAFGMAEAMRMDGHDDRYAVAVVGDGAMTGGMFYEGLNNAGKTTVNLIVVLNDNNQAISKNVGAIAKYLSKIRRKTDYVRTKWTVERVIGKAPAIGGRLVRSLKNTKDRLRRNIVQTTIFEDMGFVYLGPVDGHDIAALDETLTVAKSYRRPVVVHVQTKKGKGYAPAEKNPGEYHGVPRHEMPDGEIARIDLDAHDPELSIDECYSTVFGRELVQLAKSDKKICAVTAAMKYGTGLQFFAAAHPNRFYDVGIAEQHAVTFCAALASMGKTPVFAVYSTFLQRSFDQLLHDTAIASTHLVLGVDRAGIVGEDGETHQGIFDIPMLTAIPNCKIYSPATYAELKLCLHAALYDDTGIAAVRYPRGQESPQFPLPTSLADTHLSGADALIITYGRISEQAYEARELLRSEGISCGLLKLTAVYPIAEETVQTAKQYDRILFAEEGSRAGGIGEKLAARLLDEDYKGRFRCLAIDGFVQQAPVENALRACGLSAAGIAEHVRELLR